MNSASAVLHATLEHSSSANDEVQEQLANLLVESSESEKKLKRRQEHLDVIVEELEHTEEQLVKQIDSQRVAKMLQQEIGDCSALEQKLLVCRPMGCSSTKC